MKQTSKKLDFFKYKLYNNVDNCQNNNKNSKNITLKALYCNPKQINEPMELISIGNKMDFRIKKNRKKEEWEISDVTDSQLWMQSRAFRGIIGIKIKTIREKQGISQASFARRLGWDQGYQSRIEGGKVNLCLITLAKIAIVLGSIIKFEEKDVL